MPRFPTTLAGCLLGLLALGCSGGGELPPGAPGKGKVVFKGGDVKTLQGGSVQVQSLSDPKIIAVGDIQADGSFSLKSFADDKRSFDGLPPGDYRVRVEPPPARSDEESPRVIHERFRDFNRSGLRLKIPAENLEIAVSLK
jgi:hypothetical protein